MSVLRVACAWQRYKLEKGATPPSLEALVPNYLEALPHDYRTGEAPSRTRLTNDSWELSSLDWDMNGEHRVSLVIPPDTH
ncbi:MAG: hypothetical protein ACI8T1_003795 [Verrucomicrobiales bacterium]|jgi:hypothetical protein